MFIELLEKISQVNEVNLPARLAADDLLSSFKEAFQTWMETYKDQLSWEELNLARRMVTTADCSRVLQQKT